MNASNPDRNLLFAIGNAGRQDDGLGWAFAQALEEFPGQIEYRYQLQIEDAELMAAADRVFFVDAWKGEGAPYQLQPCEPAVDLNFSTHGLPPEVLTGWCQSLYQHLPEAWTLGIRGTEWALQIGLSAEARQNLTEALAMFQQRVMPLVV